MLSALLWVRVWVLSTLLRVRLWGVLRVRRVRVQGVLPLLFSLLSLSLLWPWLFFARLWRALWQWSRALWRHSWVLPRRRWVPGWRRVLPRRRRVPRWRRDEGGFQRGLFSRLLCGLSRRGWRWRGAAPLAKACPRTGNRKTLSETLSKHAHFPGSARQSSRQSFRQRTSVIRVCFGFRA